MPIQRCPRAGLLPMVVALLLGIPCATPTSAQFKLPGSFGSGFGGDAGNPVTVDAQFTGATAQRPAVLMITANIEPGWHVYSLTQPAGGPMKTQIEVDQSLDYRLLGPFRAYPKYKSHIDQIAWVGLELQEHAGRVTWYAPVEFAEGVDPQQVAITGTVRGQACKESCIPIKFQFEARLGSGVRIGELAFGETTPPAAASNLEAGTPSVPVEYQPADSVVTVVGQLQSAEVRPGDTVRLDFTLRPQPGWHVYALAERESTVGNKPTLIAFEDTPGIQISRPSTKAEVIEQDQSAIGWDTARLHHGPVTWTTNIKIPPGAEPGAYSVRGVIGYQACEDGPVGTGMCETIKAARFVATLNVGAQGSNVAFDAAAYSEAAALASQGPMPVGTSGQAYDLSRVTIAESGGSIAHYLALAFLGGIILNLMPCVLPVIGLKVMSFVEQAGESRSRALWLNLWYAVGIIAVFLVLAGFAIGAGLAWGGQFGNTPFNVTLAAIVFAMALSLLGVWEIPIPGFFGSGKAQEVAAKEGPMGALLKGAITTVLATPCTGPFMASAIGWAVRQPAGTTISVFGMVGLGMASPYLLIGAFPGLIRFLPKPGAWMETFKQLMGFVLLGTVVFLLSFIDDNAVLPTIILLLGVGVACWAVSKTPLTTDLRSKLETWGTAAAIVLLAGVIGFGQLDQVFARLLHGDSKGDIATGNAEEWQPFSLQKLQQLVVEDRQTVLVDFSAEWCLTCKFLERTVLHTDPVLSAIREAGVVTMYGDFTKEPPEIELTLKALGANGVPVIAVFPGADPYNPIPFSGSYTKDDIIGAIQQATRGARSTQVSKAQF